MGIHLHSWHDSSISQNGLSRQSTSVLYYVHLPGFMFEISCGILASIWSLFWFFCLCSFECGQIRMQLIFLASAMH